MKLINSTKKRACICFLRGIYFSLCFFLLFTTNVHAYIDPSVMTYAIQAIAGIAIALGTFFSVYWRRFRKKLGLNGISLTKKVRETDELYYNDPSSGKTIAVHTNKPEKSSENQSADKNPLRKFWSEYRFALILSAAISFMVIIFSPLDLYLNNVRDFWFDFTTVFPVLLEYFLLVFAVLSVLFAVCLLLFDELYHVVFIGAAAAFLCAYIQGNFLSGSLPSLDGTAIDWSLYHVNMLQSRYLWLFVPLILLISARFIKMKGIYKLTAALSTLITAMLAVSLIVVGIQNHGFDKKNYRTATSDYLFQLSEKQNFIIFIVDALDARVFSEEIADNPELREEFEDFTYFPDTVGAYTFTSYAMPQLLSGKWMENETDYQTYIKEAMDNAPLFEHLKTNDYRMGMYETSLYYDSENVMQFENYRQADAGFRSKKEFMREELKLFLFKYLPYQWKRYVNCNLQFFFQTQSLSGDIDIFSDNNRWFYEKLQDSEITKVPEKSFKFIHIEGAHVPFRYNENVEVIDSSEGSYRQNVLCSLTIMKEYLHKLKDSGVYDNTAIIMMGDHGFNYDNDNYWGRQNPALLVKGVGENHPFTISQAPLSYADLQEAYSRLIDGKNAEACFDAKEGDVRQRRYMHFIREAKITEYMQNGYASDTETLIPTGNIYERDVDYIAEFHIN